MLLRIPVMNKAFDVYSAKKPPLKKRHKGGVYGKLINQSKKQRESLLFQIKYTCPDSDDGPFSIARVHFSIRKIRYSVIHDDGTCGGEYCYDADQGLLELMVGEKDPVGYLSAEEVIEIVTKEGKK